MFTIIAFVPLISKAFFWTSLNKIEQNAIPVAITAIKKTTNVLSKIPDPNWDPWVEKAGTHIQDIDNIIKKRNGKLTKLTLNQIRSTVELLQSALIKIDTAKTKVDRISHEVISLENAKDWVEQANRLLDIFSQQDAYKLQERRVYELVMAMDRGFLPCFLSFILLFYNLVRAILTYLIVPLREEEERTGDSPKKSQYYLYWRLYQFSTLFFTVSIASGIYHLITILTAQVFIIG